MSPSRAASVLSRLRSRLGGLKQTAVRGRVERFDENAVVGSVTVPAGSRPVRIELFLNDLPVATTLAAGLDEASEQAAKNETRPFRFALRDLWRFTGKADQLSV